MTVQNDNLCSVDSVLPFHGIVCPLDSRSSSSSPLSLFPNHLLTRTSCIKVTLPTFARSWNRLCTYRADPALSPCCQACQQRIECWRKWKGWLNRLESGWSTGGSSSKSIITSFLFCILLMIIIVIIILLILKFYLQQRSLPPESATRMRIIL